MRREVNTEGETLLFANPDKIARIFEAAAQCLRYAAEIYLEEVKDDPISLKQFIIDNVSMFKEVNKFVCTFQEKLDQYSIPNNVNKTLRSSIPQFQHLELPGQTEGVPTLDIPANDENDRDYHSDLDGAGLRYNSEALHKYPMPYLGSLTTAIHTLGCEEASYNPTTNNVCSTFKDGGSEGKGILIKNLATNTTVSKIYLSNEFDVKTCVEPCPGSIIFMYKQKVVLIKDTSKVQGLIDQKSLTTANSLLWADVKAYSKDYFALRPFVSASNFYCRPEVDGNSMCLYVSDFATSDKKKIPIEGIKIASDKDKLATFTLAYLDKTPLVIVLSKSGVLATKLANKDSPLEKLDLAQTGSVYLDAFLVSPLKTIFVLSAHSNELRIQMVSVSADGKITLKDKKHITVAGDHVHDMLTDVRFGVVPLDGTALEYFIFSTKKGEFIEGCAAAPGQEASSWSRKNLVDPNLAKVIEIKPHSQVKALVLTLSSTSKESFSTIVKIKAKG